MITPADSRLRAPAVGVAPSPGDGPGRLLDVALACFGGGSEKPKPAELPPNAALIAVRPAWTARVGEVNLPLSINVNGDTVTVASSDGTVAAIDAATGRDLWRASVGRPLAAGVGSDGKLVAVVTPRQ